MTVFELIKKLQVFPQQLPIGIEYDGVWSEIEVTNPFGVVILESHDPMPLDAERSWSSDNIPLHLMAQTPLSKR